MQFPGPPGSETQEWGPATCAFTPPAGLMAAPLGTPHPNPLAQLLPGPSPGAAEASSIFRLFYDHLRGTTGGG